MSITRPPEFTQSTVVHMGPQNIQQQVLELLEEKRILYEENTQLRELLGRRDEELTTCEMKLEVMTNRHRWEAMVTALPQKTLSVSRKVTLKATMRYIEKKTPDEEGWYFVEPWRIGTVYAGQSDQTIRDNLTHSSHEYHPVSNTLKKNAVLPLFDKKVVPLQDGSGKEHTYLRPRELLYSPKSYSANVSKEIAQGGARIKCVCGSERFQKRVIMTCMDCGIVYSDEITPKPEDVSGDTPKSQVDFCPSEETLETSDLEDVSEGTPKSQVDFYLPAEETPETPDLKVNLPEYDSIVPVSQVDFYLPAEEMIIESTLVEPEDVREDTPKSQVDFCPPTEVKPEENPVTPPPMSPTSDAVTNWLRSRFGTDRVIVATGKLQAEDKYITKSASYTPDLDAYLAGQAAHIYGSWLRDPDTGTTNVLCFEIDTPEQDAFAYDYLVTLAGAGASPVYWCRYAQGRERGHLELYFDRPVHPERARAWCIDVCPQLGNIPEIYPTADKAKNALSWPLYQRIGNEITPCRGIAMLPTGEELIAMGDDLAQLGELVTRAVTPSALFDGYPLPPQPPTRKPMGGALLESPSPLIPVLSDKDLARQVIAEQNAALTWDMIADRCGGLSRGKFCAIWRGERTASVTINRDGQRATDWGQTGTSWPRNFDKYEAWCLIEGIDKKADLARRCKDIRQYKNPR